jgi:hypothetical protein
MKISFAELWNPNGTVDRKTYVLVGLVGFALKHNLDRAVATYVFHRSWGLFNYWVPVRDVARVTQLPRNEAWFLAVMVMLALPFVWLGVAMSMKRLRSANLSLQLVGLFFVPLLNLLFFLVLSLVPERHPRELASAPDSRRLSLLARIVPESVLGSAAISLLLTVPIGLGFAFLGVRLLANYGWGLFVALPFVMGLAAAVLHGIHVPRSLGACLQVACLSVVLLGAALLAFAIEGLLCILMVVPIALPLAAIGGVCGYFMQRQRWLHAGAPAFLSALILFVPGVQISEHLAAPPPETFIVRSSIDVHAPPQEVWNKVVTFSQIPPPAEWLFRSGIAYPIRAEIHGTGRGAERRCVFSTGAFVEPIEIWDAPRLLKFSVTSNPPSMEEWSPYSHIEPAHLHGFLVSEGGQFLLTPLPGGGTHLEGTTWYRHGLWPEAYWRLWSDAIIHRIHMRVLTHIRDEAEKKAPHRGA